jgi:hypothetical protein
MAEKTASIGWQLWSIDSTTADAEGCGHESYIWQNGMAIRGRQQRKAF